MKKIILSTAVAAAVSSLTAYAGEYQFQGSAHYLDGETGDIDTETYSINGTAYLSRVDDSLGPYGEAAFLNKASSLSINYSDSETDSGSTTIDSDALSVHAEYIIPSSDIIIGARYSDGEVEDIDVESYGLSIGKYLGERTAVTADYNVTEEDDALDLEIESLGFNIHHVSGDQDGKRLAIDATFTHSIYENDSIEENFNTISFNVTAYLCKCLGISAGYAVTTGDILDGDTYSAGAEYFINPKIAVDFTYSNWRPNDSDLDSTDTFSIGVIGRF